MHNFPEADSVAAAQYYSHFGGGPLGPEETLMLAVLDDAIECFHKYTGARDGKSERLFLEAQEWILERGSDCPFSFENICDVLRLDPNYIRCGLLRKQQLLSGAPKEKLHFTTRRRVGGASRRLKPRATKTPTTAARALFSHRVRVGEL